METYSSISDSSDEAGSRSIGAVGANRQPRTLITKRDSGIVMMSLPFNFQKGQGPLADANCPQFRWRVPPPRVLSTLPQTAATAAHFTQRVRHRIRYPDTVGSALLAGTAAVGSYTTFSTWMLETPLRAEERQTAGRGDQHRCKRDPRTRRRPLGSDHRRTYLKHRGQHQGTVTSRAIAA